MENEKPLQLIDFFYFYECFRLTQRKHNDFRFREIEGLGYQEFSMKLVVKRRVQMNQNVTRYPFNPKD